MFIHISEYGEVSKSKEIPDGILEACDDGIWDIIDISNPEEPKRYIDGEWVDINYL